MRLLPVILATLVAVGVHTAPATAGVPDPHTSTTPTYFQMCPAGDLTQSVVVRDVTGSPLNNVVVEFDLCACPGLMLCSPLPGDPCTIVSGCQVRTISNAFGLAFFPVRGGGGCTGPVPVSADGVLLANLGLSVSPDQDGNGVVDGTDATILSTKIGGPDLTGDLDGNGAVNATDATILAAHLGHTCDGVVPARGVSWGAIKVTYR